MSKHDVDRPRRLGTIIRRSILGVIGGVVALAVVAAMFLGWTIQRSFPQVQGTVELTGLTSEVSVQRDELGVPTITANNPSDLFFTQGYVHAQDRFWEMDFRRHVTSGRVSELFGASQLETDTFLRTLGWREIAEQEVSLMDETTLGYYESYADGVNAYLAEHQGADVSLEYAVLGLQNAGYEPEPWEPADSVAWLKAMAWDLRTNIDEESERALLAPEVTPEQLAQLYPAYPFDRNPVIVPVVTAASPRAATATGRVTPEQLGVDWQETSGVVEAVHALVGGVGEGIGSNSWVVSGQHTESGKPLLANDPHLSANLPSVWYQVGLKCGAVSPVCPFDVSGFSFSGMPGVVIGHNAKVAWGFTNLTTDVADLYIERLQGDSYWRDGALVPIESRKETIKVAGGDDVTITIRSTVHGPIISDDGGQFAEIADNAAAAAADGTSTAPEGDAFAVSLQWTALEPSTTPQAIFDLNTATDYEQFRAAAALFTVPAQNMIYADTSGNIGYQAPGSLPIRGAGDGFLPTPGWDSAYDWTGYIPFDELPRAYNPTSGYIVTANNAIVTDEYTYFLSRDWDYGYRAARIEQLLQRAIANAKVTALDMQAIQADSEFWVGKQLITAVADVKSTREGPTAALELLQGWDAQNDANSAAAAYANVLWDTLVSAMFVERDVPLPVGDQARMFTLFDTLLATPDDPLWVNASLGIDGKDEMLAYAVDTAYDRLRALQGEVVTKWSWGSLHALTLTHGTFGESGIAPIEALFNRGPYATGGGSSVVNATGWVLGEGFATVTVPSMRMVTDLADFDASTWNNLTGASGHAFHRNYVDQSPAWSRAEQTPWAFSEQAVTEAARDTLILRPAS